MPWWVYLIVACASAGLLWVWIYRREDFPMWFIPLTLAVDTVVYAARAIVRY